MHQLNQEDESARRHVEGILWKLTAGELGLHDLPSWLLAWYVVPYDQGFEQGFDQGVRSCRATMHQLEHDRDRYWRAAFAPKRKIQIGLSYADRLRMWGQHEKAEQVEADLAAMKFEVQK